MSKIKNSALDQYGAEPFEQQQFGTAGAEGVKLQVYNIHVYCKSKKPSTLYSLPSWPIFKILSSSYFLQNLKKAPKKSTQQIVMCYSLA